MNYYSVNGFGLEGDKFFHCERRKIIKCVVMKSQGDVKYRCKEDIVNNIAITVYSAKWVLD